MRGLSWGDYRLQLTRWQWGAVVWQAACWLCQYLTQFPAWIALLLTLPMGLAAFWGVPIGIDNILLWRGVLALRGVPWATYLKQALKYPYLEFQTPFWPWLLTRYPILTFWQVALCLPLSIINTYLLFEIAGPHAALLLAAPVYVLTIWQPSTDTLLLTLLLLMQATAAHLPIFASVLFAVAFAIKPLAILILPLAFMATGHDIIYGLVLIWVLIFNASQVKFGRHQIDFILSQLLIRRLPREKQIAGENTAKRGGKPFSWRQWVTHTLRWRFQNILRPAFSGLVLLLFPMYLHPWNLLAYLLGAVILGGYCNIKYFLLVYPFCFLR